MEKVKDFYLESLYHSIISCPGIDSIDPILLAEFKNAKRKLDTNTWNKIKDLFMEKEQYTFETLEKMCFFILACSLEEEILDKDPDFISTLCSFLVSITMPAFSYVQFVKEILKEPIYSACIEFQRQTDFFWPLNLIYGFQGTTNQEEEWTNDFLREFYRLNGERYYFFYSEDDDLFTIYLKIRNEMLKRNQEQLVYVKKDFEALEILKQIVNSENEFMIYQTLMDLMILNTSCNSTSKLIKSILIYLEAKIKKVKHHGLILLRKTKKQN